MLKKKGLGETRAPKIDLSRYIKESQLKIRVIPKSSRCLLRGEIPEERGEGQLKLYLTAAPEKDKANKAVIKFFKDEYGLKVKIKLGIHSREKILEIEQ